MARRNGPKAGKRRVPSTRRFGKFLGNPAAPPAAPARVDLSLRASLLSLHFVKDLGKYPFLLSAGHPCCQGGIPRSDRGIRVLCRSFRGSFWSSEGLALRAARMIDLDQELTTILHLSSTGTHPIPSSSSPKPPVPASTQAAAATTAG